MFWIILNWREFSNFIQTVVLAEKKNKLLEGPAYILDKITEPLKIETELRLASIIQAYKLKTVSNLKFLKWNLVQLITEFYLTVKEWSDHEKQVGTRKVDNRDNFISLNRDKENFLPTVCKQPTEFPIIVYDFPDPVCPYAKTQAL